MPGQDPPTFLHFSDAHIGHRQYNLKKRRDDVYMSFRSVISETVDKIDFAVFGGDLFHNKKVNARALNDAEKGLDIFHEKDVPVIGIRGNHDANLYTQDLNWLEYLHQRGKFVLLKPDLESDKLLEKHDPENPGKSSGYAEIDGVRIFGLQYVGKQTPAYIEKMAEAIRKVEEERGEPDATMMLGHFGIEGHVPGMGDGLSYSELEPLKDLVDYLGLGHLHKEYSHDDWVYNPGSLEAHNSRQAQWSLGYYLGEVDGDLQVEHRESKRRPFHRIDLQVDGSDSMEELKEALEEKIGEERSALQDKILEEKYTRKGEPRKPVIDFHLRGLLQFNRSGLDVDFLEKKIREELDAMYVTTKDATESKQVLEAFKDIEEDGEIDRERLELTVFQNVTEKDSRYEDEKEEVAKTLASIKADLSNDESVENVAETVKTERRRLFSGGQE